MNSALRKRLGVKQLKDLVVFENDNYMVVNKPPHLSTLADRQDPIHLLGLFKEVSSEIQACHRIDKETSGALVLAKNPEAYRNLAMQFEARTVKKVYHAVVDGLHELDQEVELSLMAVDSGKVIVSAAGKKAKTRFKSIKGFKYHTLVECYPTTGRKHQIRVHLAHLRASISGDKQYGGRHIYLSKVKKRFNLKAGTEELPISRRFLLHALRIEFKDVNEDVISVEAPYPKDFRVVVKQLDQNSF